MEHNGVNEVIEKAMSPLEQELVDYLTEIKERRIGFMELRTDVDGWCADISLDARYDLFTSECIFDDCDDARAECFLKAFLQSELDVSWSVSEQLSKLLSIRGGLVSHVMDPILTTRNWDSIGNHLLFLSYLAVKKDGATLAMRLLDQVPNDGRDGLFLACFKLTSEELDRKLIRKFEEWDTQNWDPANTGELGALKKFIGKWLRLYHYKELEAVIRLYFRHCEEL